MTTIEELAKLGQSIWLDNINRKMLEDGTLAQMIAQGLRGMTSNPSIFEKAVVQSSDYDKKITDFAKSGKGVFEIYDALTIKDIQDAADIFMPVYNQTKGLNGYVSLEVNPKLAYLRDATIEEAKRIFKKVNRPNLMCKVPATSEGFGAVEDLIASGINVNVTLIFSLTQYIGAANAYIAGLTRLKNKDDIRRVCSVASVFVSRTDTVVDALLDKLAAQQPEKRTGILALKGRAACANCVLIYAKYLELFGNGQFKALGKTGANKQRVLWASTSTKNPAYSDIKYVTELIALDTVNTLPENTFAAFLDHGVINAFLSDNIFSAEGVVLKLRELGVGLDEILSQLLSDGVIAFERSFDSLLSTIAIKTQQLCVK